MSYSSQNKKYMLILLLLIKTISEFDEPTKTKRVCIRLKKKNLKLHH